VVIIIVIAFGESILAKLVQFLRGTSDNAVSLEQTRFDNGTSYLSKLHGQS